MLVGALVFAFVSPRTAISPGALLGAHESIGDDCFACHTPLLGSRPEKCVTCHAVDRIGLFTTAGQPIGPTKAAFHQHLTEHDCMACHAEHRGTASARTMKPFSHELLDPTVRAECASCHVKPQDSLHGQIDGGCQQCHRSDAWRPATFDHARFFLLEGEHEAACATCHVAGDFANYTNYTCYGCHEHSPAGIRAEHVEEGIRDFENCVKCHRSADERRESGERDDD
ncbi:class III cytochrome C family protein [Panacagrimonas perspica]|nr:class III cytochrome C family protein [Panacagrimonas perspica]